MLSFNTHNIHNTFSCLRNYIKRNRRTYEANKDDYQVVVNVIWQKYDDYAFGDYEIFCGSIDEVLEGSYIGDERTPFVEEKYTSNFIEMGKSFAEENKFPAWISGYIEMCSSKEGYTDFSVDEYTVKQYV